MGNRQWRVEDDRNGFKVWASEVTREWTGKIVRKVDVDLRSPQELIRGRRDHQAVQDARPDSNTFANARTTTLTEDEPSGETVLAVTSSSGFTAGNYVHVYQDTETVHQTTIASVDSATQITLTVALTAKASSGNNVTDTGASP